MMFKTHLKLQLALLAVSVIGIFAGWANADDDDRRTRLPLLPKYQQECGSCHAPYPSHLLPAAAWQRILANLKQHYGTDASLDAQSTAELSKWLSTNAAKRTTQAPPEDRITRSAWFQHEHDEVTAASWKHAAVKSPANCGACHTQADQGDYRERNIRIPR